MVSGTLVYDVETHSKELLYSMPPEKFVRLIGYKWKGSDEVTLTTDLEEIRSAIRSARWIVTHNGNDFDLPAVFGTLSDEPIKLAMAKRVYDTWDHAVLVNSIPREYTNRHGELRKAPKDGWKPEQTLPWYGLDEQAFQLGVAGKTADLKELALEFGDPELPRKARIADGFGKIPVDDQRYRDYLVGDVLASERVAVELLKRGPLDDYALREQNISAVKAVIKANGLRLHQPAAEARRDELAARREVILSELQERYGLPTDGASPWDTTEGKVAILAALADHGITQKSRPNWTKTPAWENREDKIRESREKAAKLRADARGWREELAGGQLKPRSVQSRERWVERAEREADDREAIPLPPAFGHSLSGDTLKELTKDTQAEELGTALAELKGQRSLSQLALDSVYPDGFVHPEITMLQRSGRWSTTEPGLTVWTNNGPGAVEKAYFVPDNADDVLMEFDYSNADARMVAAESGDRAYAVRFQPGQDGHMINAIAAWGKDAVAADPKSYRQRAKVPGHGWGYRIGAKKLASGTGMPEDEARMFLNNMNKAFKDVVKWQEGCEKYARRHGYIVNDWGRRMPVEKGREYNQPPALIGQSGTREIVCDFLLSLPLHILRRVKAQIHDAVLMSIPRRNWEACRDYVLSMMETSYEPRHGKGQRIDFPASAGPPGGSWFEAIH
jgi:DNA polymerase-1